MGVWSQKSDRRDPCADGQVLYPDCETVTEDPQTCDKTVEN